MQSADQGAAHCSRRFKDVLSSVPCRGSNDWTSEGVEMTEIRKEVHEEIDRMP